MTMRRFRWAYTMLEVEEREPLNVLRRAIALDATLPITYLDERGEFSRSAICGARAFLLWLIPIQHDEQRGSLREWMETALRYADRYGMNDFYDGKPPPSLAVVLAKD